MITVSLYGLILLLVKLSWTVAFLAPEWGHGGGGFCWSVAPGLKNTEGRPGSYSFLRVKKLQFTAYKNLRQCHMIKWIK